MENCKRDAIAMIKIGTYMGRPRFDVLIYFLLYEVVEKEEEPILETR